MKKKCFCLTLAFLSGFATTNGQSAPQDSAYRKFSVGSTLFVLSNLLPDDNPPGFVQLNLGYRITPADVISVELKTWRYAWPLGIPYGKSFQAHGEKYPGFIRDYGVAFAYQHFWWKGVYSAVHAMSALQKYTGDDRKKIGSGYQLFMTYRLGYHIPLFRNRFFIEPSIAMTHWPVRTNVPEPFAGKDRPWPKIFFPEPGLHFGLKF